MKKMETYKVTPTQVRKTFLKYTEYNIPSGESYRFYDKIPRYDAKQYFDKSGNIYCVIGYKPNVMFAAHMDDVSAHYRQVIHDSDGRYVRATHGEVLGADDKSGITIMDFMMKNNVPGIYAFFVDEECGCQGSTASATDFDRNVLDLYSGNPSQYGEQKTTTKMESVRVEDKSKKDKWPKYKYVYKEVESTEFSITPPKYPTYTGNSSDHPLRDINIVISFDRRGYDSIVTQQAGYTTASDAFALSLSDELAKYGVFMSPDPTGVYTDSREFAPYIAECTNISVGYFDQHSRNESQDILFMTTLINALLQLNWKNLLVEREPAPRYSYRGKGKMWEGIYSYNDYGDYYQFDEPPFKDDAAVDSFLPPTLNENFDDAYFCKHCDTEYNKYEIRDFAYDLYSDTLDKKDNDISDIDMEKVLLYCEDCGEPLVTVEDLFTLEAEIVAEQYEISDEK